MGAEEPEPIYRSHKDLPTSQMDEARERHRQRKRDMDPDEYQQFKKERLRSLKASMTSEEYVRSACSAACVSASSRSLTQVPAMEGGPPCGA